MSRIDLSDDGMSAIVKMAEGNPGAMQALMELLTEGEKVDPQSFMGGMGKIMILDTWEIYGSSIYVLWSDKCHKNTRRFIMLLRATQMGWFSVANLKVMAADQGFEFNITDEEFDELDAKVCSELEEFQRPEVPA